MIFALPTGIPCVGKLLKVPKSGRWATQFLGNDEESIWDKQELSWNQWIVNADGSATAQGYCAPERRDSKDTPWCVADKGLLRSSIRAVVTLDEFGLVSQTIIRSCFPDLLNDLAELRN